jgi:putative FmdB family regulatory protein
MPVYDFQCEKCGSEFEAERAFGSTAKMKCPHCGSTRTTKVFSAAGIVFKGSGFYVTDSKSGASKSPEKTGKPLETKTDSTPAAETPSSSPDTTPSTPNDTKTAKKGKSA